MGISPSPRRLSERPRWPAPIVTLSAGIAEYRPGEGIESLMRRADRALYEAKYAGRNRVHLAAA